MLTDADVLDMLTTFSEAYSRKAPTEQTVAVWKAALGSLGGDEMREAAYTLLADREHMPTPADVLRVAREQRAAKKPPVETMKGDIPLQDGVRKILDDLEARMRRDGKIPPKRKNAPEPTRPARHLPHPPPAQPSHVSRETQGS